MPHGVKGELDLVGYDGKTLAFVEVRTRPIREDVSAIPELPHRLRPHAL
jgi:Holliday junction resolvase-like predicted endonuclease